MLAIADMLPVMTAYVDRDLVYRFINKPLAEWLGRPRKDVLGRTMREVHGRGRVRRPRADARGGAGRRAEFFAAEFDHPTRGPLAAQTDYVPWADATGEVRGIIVIVHDITEQRVDRARAARERGAVPADRQFGAGDDVGDAARPGARLRQRGLCRVRLRAGVRSEEARTLDWRTRIHPDDVDRIVAESIAGEASLQRFTLEGAVQALRRRISLAAQRVAAALRRRTGSWSGSSASASDITLAKEAELELRREVEERTAQLAPSSEAQFRAVFEAALEVMVLLEPDGTVVAVNNRREAWRHDEPARGDRAEAVGRADHAAPIRSTSR